MVSLAAIRILGVGTGTTHLAVPWGVEGRAMQRRKRRLLGTLLGVGISFVVAGSALGASWQTPVNITGSDFATAADIVTLDTHTIVAAYDVGDTTDTIYVRRSANSGASWTAPMLVAAGGIFPDLSSNGSQVDLVYNAANGRVWYRHSNDGGVSFASAIAISPSGDHAWRAAVGRGPSGIVAVVYSDIEAGKAAVRVSVDGGGSFGTAKTLSTSATDQASAVAVGDGVIYAGYSNGFSDLRIKRSTNNGATWSSATSMSHNLFDDDYSIVADGTHAYVAYTDEGTTTFSTIHYRRTLNSGATWSAPMNLAPTNWSTEDPSLGLAAGVLRASFTRCIEDFDVCDPNLIYYRQSTNGTSWGTTKRISPNTLFDASRANVGSHFPVVSYIGEDSSSVSVYVRAKT